MEDFQPYLAKMADELQLAKRLIDKTEQLAQDPFPRDVKRVVNQKEKVFRVRAGDYRIQYCVFPDRNLLFITYIDNRERAYDQHAFTFSTTKA